MMQLSLKQKMLIPLLSSVILSAAIAFPFIHHQLSSLKSKVIHDLVVNKKGEIERAEQKAGLEAEQKAALFSQLPAVINAYKIAHSGNINDETDPKAQKAREMLRHDLEAMLAGYESLTGGKKLKLHFHLPNGRSLARMWRNKQTKRNGQWVDVSDDISSFRKTVLEVNKSGKPISGIELGRGGFVVRGLVPIKANNQELGSDEVLVDFKPIFKNAAAESGQEILLYMNADKLPITKQLQDKSKYPVLADKYVLVSGSKDGKAEEKISPDFLDRGRQGLVIQESGNHALAAFPVKDFQKKQIGVMVFYLDIAGVQAGIESIILIIALVLAAILVIIVVVNYIALIKAIINPVSGISKALKNNSHEVNSSSTQISSSSQTLAEGASEAAASIEETSASLEEISSIIKQNADNAAHADALMGQTKGLVETADNSMQQLNKSMEEITVGSQVAFKIIKTIDEIAFQTNLLALNAAVEAARAGEAGAGFSVVADEVRNLAMRAAEAAKNTSELIEGTVNKIKEGSTLVAKTNEAFNGVRESSGKVGHIVSEIATASQEQAKGIAQINTSTSEMDRVIQQNAANAEESAAAAEELNAMSIQMDHLARELNKLIGGQEFTAETKTDNSIPRLPAS